MQKISLHCETITPMFLAGADGRTPELRPPSIKGLLRFWWRAKQGNMSFITLQQREGDLFGAADENIGKSKIRIRVESADLDESNCCRELWDEVAYVLQKTKDGKQYKTAKDRPGIQYLLYSAAMLNTRGYIKAPFEFSVHLCLKDNFTRIDEAINAMWLSSLFGGLGTRARRGAGNFCVTKIEGYNAATHLFETKHILQKEKLKDFLEQKLKQILPTTKVASYSTLKGSTVYILDPSTNWIDALETIGKPFWSFRQSHKSQLQETPNFGFPIRHKNGTTMVAGPQKGKKFERLASPLIFRIIKTTKDTFFPIILYFNGDIIPNGYEIMDTQGGNRKAASDKIVKEFLSTTNALELAL